MDFFRELSESLNEPFDDVVDILVNLDKRNLELVSVDAPLDQEWSAKAISAFNCKPKLTIRPKKKEEVMDDLLPQWVFKEIENSWKFQLPFFINVMSFIFQGFFYI